VPVRARSFSVGVWISSHPSEYRVLKLWSSARMKRKFGFGISRDSEGPQEIAQIAIPTKTGIRKPVPVVVLKLFISPGIRFIIFYLGIFQMNFE
jgi:hypothetical protein